jgi:hypothetical protein
MPEGNLGLGKCRRGTQEKGQTGGTAGQKCLEHDVLPINVIATASGRWRKTMGVMPRPGVQSAGDGMVMIA